MQKIIEFESGGLRDIEDEKEDYIESISWLTLKRYAKYMDKCAVKYGRGNWMKGLPIDRYERGLLRHIQKYISNKYYGTNIEPEVDHEAAILFNIQGLIHEQEKENIKKEDELREIINFCEGN